MATANLLCKRTLEDDLETKPVLKKPKEISEEKETAKEQTEGSLELSETKSDQATFISVKETAAEGVDEAPYFVEEPKKTLFVGYLSPQTELSDIIDFFKDVGQVVRVRLKVTRKRIHRTVAFVEFASADEAKKALEKTKGESLLDRQIFLDVANKGGGCLPPKEIDSYFGDLFMYCLDHTVWYGDYPQRESLSIEEDDETPLDPVEAVLFIANLSPQTTSISHIIKFFKDVGKVVSVRLIVDQEGKRLGYGFVEFASAHEAKWALKNKNGEYLHDHKILLMKGKDKTPDSAERFAVREKTLYVGNLSYKTKISDIINFFKDVGEVVHVRLMVHHKVRHVDFGFVEFASAEEAKKALEKKNGEYLHNRDVVLDVVKTSPYPLRSKFCIDHKVWYQDNPQRESLLVEDDAAVETPDFLEEVAVRKKTVFVANIYLKKDNIGVASHFINFFKGVGEVVGVRLIVDDEGEHVGCGFVEFASADEAMMAVHKKNNRWIYVNMAEIASPYPFRPKYNLHKLAKKLWYEDSLRREGFGLENTPDLEKQQVVFCSKKITFSDED